MNKTEYLRRDDVLECCQLIGFRTDPRDFRKLGSIYGATEEDLKGCPTFTRDDFERPGAWIKRDGLFMCGRCLCWQNRRSAYCPDCGAKMTEAE